MEAVNKFSCPKCNLVKASSDFYQKGAHRIDSVCKDCRKAERRARYQRPQPKVIIEPSQENTGQPKVVIEPKKYENNDGSQSVVDCKIWEEMYNRKLTDIEKAEIKFNVLLFLSVLDDIYQSGEVA